MSVQFTEEQQAAISRRGRVIVSASAGSGKTAVMIERLVSLILNGVSVSEVLAVTFTNKAAAQMREKLRAAILQRITQSRGEEKARLKTQLLLLPSAEISTIHAFCGRLVRSYFFLAETDAAFRIISPDDAEGKELSARAMEETFDCAYEEGSAQFKSLLSVYFRGKKDARLRGVVSALYTKFRGMADYRSALSAAGKEDAFENVCYYIAQSFCEKAVYFKTEAEALARFFEGNNARALNVCADIVRAAEALSEIDLFSLTEAAQEAPVIARMPPSTRAEGEELRALRALSYLSSGIKELYAELKKYGAREEEYARYLDAQSRASSLCALVLRYDEIYTRLKRERGALDYNDLEHCALRVLSDAAACEDLRARYRYLFVDEYQDVNPAQEEILSRLGGEEVFLVGDRKQAIYAFRGSKSEFFTKKTEAFDHALYLTENFRSASAVLDGVNRVFARAMTKETCGISYAENSLMRGGRRYGAHEGRVIFHRVPEEKDGRSGPAGVYSVSGDRERTVIDAQAQTIADIVLSEVGCDWFDADAGVVRKVCYGDIAVLVRKTSGDAEKAIAALSERDIPVTSSAKTNLYDHWEIRMLLDWLSYLDNAEQDIPLAGAMRSSVGGFDENDFAEISLWNRNREKENEKEKSASAFFFRDACKQYARKLQNELAERLRAFAKKTERLRALCAVKSAGDVLNLLLSEGLEAEIAAKKEGGRRLARVRRLIEEAEGSVHDFLCRLNRTEQADFSESGGENAVKVLTMHASKGLEYPVVILASLDAPFHGAEREEVMFTELFSVAPKSFDAKKKLVYDTVLRRASAIYEEREEVKGELNLLYVAMTRAKFRLHMLFGMREDRAPAKYAKRFSDFIDFSDCAQYFSEEKERAFTAAERKALVYPVAGETEEILSVYARPYPYEASTLVKVKSSATDLLKELQKENPLSYRSFVRAEGSASAETGTAYHAFLQHVDFSADAEGELRRMREENILTEEQAAMIDLSKVRQILAMPALRALAGKRLWREQTFLVGLQADEMGISESAEELVFQGAIDLLYRDEEGYTVIDYKFSGLDDRALGEKYAPQILLYRKAVARVFRLDERQVRARIINIKLCREIEM